MELPTMIDPNATASAVLFLPGVHFSNLKLLDEQFDETIMNMVDAAGIDLDIEIVAFDRIPASYKNSTWPESTNLKCWNCDCSFGRRPVFIPESIMFEGDELVATVDRSNGGNFCSGSCAFTYINREFSESSRWGRVSMLKTLLADMFGAVPELTLVQPKIRRQEYGGTLSVTEYRAQIDTSNQTPPVVMARLLGDD